MYQELFSPEHNSYATFPGGTYDGMVILRGHKVHGVCPHHLMPVEMRAYVAYIPHRTVLGLSKLARVVEEHLTGPILQEDLTERIAEALKNRTDPKGVGVVIVGRHGCMRHRGVETDADIITSSMRGVFLTNGNAREEFLRLCGQLS
jgi:GTP cyclohydrolase I